MENNQVEQILIQKINAGAISEATDNVAVEEPLEIRLEYSSPNGRMQKNIAVTMRTPGNDAELAIGFLFTEGIIQNKLAVKQIKESPANSNSTLVILEEDIQPTLSNIARNFYSTSSCGICGKASIDSIRTIAQFNTENDCVRINAEVFYNLQVQLKKRQTVFEETGGIHACALFDLDGNFILLKEDVGRHNALDKVIGAALLNDQLPLNNALLLLSGRASFELVQKAAMAGITIIAAVGAPSSLAIEMAKEAGITLLGFLRDYRFNIYSGEQRIKSTKIER